MDETRRARSTLLLVALVIAGSGVIAYLENVIRLDLTLSGVQNGFVLILQVLVVVELLYWVRFIGDPIRSTRGLGFWRGTFPLCFGVAVMIFIAAIIAMRTSPSVGRALISSPMLIVLGEVGAIGWVLQYFFQRA